MKYDKIMAGGNLENIMARLKGCCALLNLLYESAGASSVSEAAVAGMLDLLEMVCRDFQADIDSAGDYTGKGRRYDWRGNAGQAAVSVGKSGTGD